MPASSARGRQRPPEAFTAKNGESMKHDVIYREQLPIYEVHLDDGSFGIQIGENGPIHGGYYGEDLIRVLTEIGDITRIDSLVPEN